MLVVKRYSEPTIWSTEPLSKFGGSTRQSAHAQVRVEKNAPDVF